MPHPASPGNCHCPLPSPTYYIGLNLGPLCLQTCLTRVSSSCQTGVLCSPPTAVAQSPSRTSVLWEEPRPSVRVTRLASCCPDWQGNLACCPEPLSPGLALKWMEHDLPLRVVRRLSEDNNVGSAQRWGLSGWPVNVSSPPLSDRYERGCLGSP